MVFNFQIELIDGSGVMISSIILREIEEDCGKFSEKPGRMVAKLLRAIIGTDDLRNMGLLRNGAHQQIPPTILRAVRSKFTSLNK